MGQVNLSETAEKSLIAAMAADKALISALSDAVTRTQQLEFLEQMKQYAVTEANLAKAREEIARKDQTISDLHQRIAQLNGFLSSMSTGAPSYPIATTYPVPTFQDRQAAQAPWSVPAAPQQYMPPAGFTEAPAQVSAPAGS